MAYVIPKNEYFERIAKFQARIKAAGLDACLVHGTESDFANVRYLSEYWPTFEQAGVFVPAEGDAQQLFRHRLCDSRDRFCAFSDRLLSQRFPVLQAQEYLRG